MNQTPLILQKIPASRFTEVAGLKIHYFDWGAADAPMVLLYVHGWTATGIESMPLAEHLVQLGAPVRVIAVDLPGCGFSERPNVSLGMAGYTVFLARWLVAVQESLHVAPGARFVLWAHSMGAHISLNTLWDYRFGPEDAGDDGAGGEGDSAAGENSRLRSALARVERVVLCAPDGLYGEEGPLLMFRNRRLLKFLAPLMNRFLYNLAARFRVYRDVRRCPPLVLDVEWESLHYENGVESVIDITVDTLSSNNLDGRLGAFTLPVLMVWGHDDHVLPFHYSQQFAAALPDLRFHSFADCGHVPHIEKVQEVAALLQEFL